MFGLTPYRRNSNISADRGFRSPWSNIDRVFESFFNGYNFTPFSNNDVMKVDIKETDQEYIVDAEIPGVDKDDIKLDLNDNMLTIQVKKSVQQEEENDRYIRKEIRRSSTSRSFYVENIKVEEITAKYENGVLHILLPKADQEDTKKKSIDIE